MTKTIYSKLTHKPRRKKKAGGEVPFAHLYKDIDRGFRHFLANRIERETLRSAPVRIR